MKTRTTGVIALLGVTLLVSAGCRFSFGKPVRGDGNVVTRSHEVSGIDGVELRCQGNLEIVLGSEESLVIETDENLHEYFEVKMEGGDVVISSADGYDLRPTTGIDLRLTVVSLGKIIHSASGGITAPHLQAEEFLVSMNGSGDVRIASVRTENCELNLSGSGEIVLESLESDELDVSIAGSGEVVVDEGEVRSQSISISGSGGYAARRLASREAFAAVAGSGGITLSVSDKLEASISGSGGIRYDGDPELTTDITGSGNVRRL